MDNRTSWGALSMGAVVVSALMAYPSAGLAEELVPLRVETSPAGASVYADGQLRGETPASIHLPEGKHKLFLYKPGMLPVQREISLMPGDRPIIQAPLRPQSGGLVVLSDPPGARVGFDGRLLGRTPLAFERLPTGEHDLTIRKEGFDEFHDVVQIDDGAPNEVRVLLQGPPVSVFVSAEEGTRVYVDGSYAGEVSRDSLTLRIRAGTHEFRMEQNGFASVQTMTLAPGRDAFVETGELKRIPGLTDVPKSRLNPRWYLVSASAGVGLISGVLGGLSLHQAYDARDEYESAFLRDDIESAKERIVWGNRGFMAGTAIAALGAAGAWWAWPADDAAPQATLGSDRLLLTWRF